MMLAVQNRNTEDPCSLGELFVYFCDELADITFREALTLLLSLLHQFLEDNFDISEKEIDDMVEKFIQLLPSSIQDKMKRQAAWFRNSIAGLYWIIKVQLYIYMCEVWVN